MELLFTFDVDAWWRIGYEEALQEKLKAVIGEEIGKCCQTFSDLAKIDKILLEVQPSKAHSYLGQMTIRKSAERNCLSGLMRLANGVLFKADETELRNVIMHEILHLLPGGKGHIGLWRSRAEAINQKYGYNIKRCGVSPDGNISREAYKYLLVCQNCGQKYYYRRKSRAVKHFRFVRCGKCYGRLGLTILKKAEN